MGAYTGNEGVFIEVQTTHYIIIVWKMLIPIGRGFTDDYAEQLNTWCFH